VTNHSVDSFLQRSRNTKFAAAHRPKDFDANPRKLAFRWTGR
jgi:hypothetical protein